MSLKLYDPIPGKTPNYRIRGKLFGVRVDRSTGTANPRLADKILRDTIRQLEDEAMRGPAKPKGKEFREGVEIYLRQGGEDKFLKPLLEYFEGVELEKITQEMIDEAAWYIHPDSTPATRNRQVYTPMSAILKANRLNVPIRRPKGWRGQSRTFFFEPEDVQRLIEVAVEREPEFGLFLMFLLYTGVRLNEGLSLQIHNLNLSKGKAYIEKTKNGLPRVLHLPPPLIAAMANHPRGYNRQGKVFRYVKGSRLYGRLKQAAEAADVRIPDGVSFHAFRHTYGAYLRRYGNLDTSGLVASGAWISHDAARRYEHADVTKAAKASNYFPAIQVFGGNDENPIKLLKKTVG